MKKVLFLAVAALAFVACGNNKPKEAVEEIEVEAVELTAPVDSALVAVDSTVQAAAEEVVEEVKEVVE